MLPFILPIISTLGDAFAILCALAIFPWILGVPGDPGEPGHESDYARGWKMGLVVVCAYPIVRALGVAAVWGIRFLAAEPVRARGENVVSNLSALIFFAALLRLLWSFRVLSKN